MPQDGPSSSFHCFSENHIMSLTKAVHIEIGLADNVNLLSR